MRACVAVQTEVAIGNTRQGGSVSGKREFTIGSVGARVIDYGCPAIQLPGLGGTSGGPAVIPTWLVDA